METLSDRVGQTLLELGLKREHRDSCDRSFKGFRPTYHNEEHCYSTALTYRDLAQRADQPISQQREGFLAALYHDAGHRGGADENANIGYAVAWWEVNSPQELKLAWWRVSELIRSTHNQNHGKRSRQEALLHDADILQTVKGERGENARWRRLLSDETGRAITEESSLTFVEGNLLTTEGRALLEARLTG